MNKSHDAGVVRLSGAKLERARVKRFGDETPAAQVAKLLGVRRQTLHGYETGAKEPSANRLLHMMMLYRVDAADLIE